MKKFTEMKADAFHLEPDIISAPQGDICIFIPMVENKRKSRMRIVSDLEFDKSVFKYIFGEHGAEHPRAGIEHALPRHKAAGGGKAPSGVPDSFLMEIAR